MNQPAKKLAAVAILALFAGGCTERGAETDSPERDRANDPDKKEWIELFNGRDLDDWIIKIGGYPVGENALDTFRVEDGKLVARYDQYEEFGGRFGHIFYQEPFSHYIIQVEYRFVGEQIAGAPAWAWRNNGIMYHAQSPHDMELGQGFPACIEFQLLGGDGVEDRPTGNLVTPGTRAVVDGELREEHIIEVDGETYHGDQWVAAELEVHGNDLAIHRVEGEELIRYSGMQLEDGTPLTSGYIALQAESHPAEFRKVRLLNLKGCMDPQASNFKSYFVADDPDACRY